MAAHPLTALFHPKSVAVIGASTDPEKVGHTVVKNLIDGHFPGSVYPINPHETKILDLKVYPSITKTPRVPDLAVVVVPAPVVLTVVQECGQVGVCGCTVWKFEI